MMHNLTNVKIETVKIGPLKDVLRVRDCLMQNRILQQIAEKGEILPCRDAISNTRSKIIMGGLYNLFFPLKINLIISKVTKNFIKSFALNNFYRNIPLKNETLFNCSYTYIYKIYIQSAHTHNYTHNC